MRIANRSVWFRRKGVGCSTSKNDRVRRDGAGSLSLTIPWHPKHQPRSQEWTALFLGHWPTWKLGRDTALPLLLLSCSSTIAGRDCHCYWRLLFWNSSSPIKLHSRVLSRPQPRLPLFPSAPPSTPTMQWLASLAGFCAPLFLILSPILSYSDQALSMHRNKSSAGFSLDIPLIMLVASFFRCGHAPSSSQQSTGCSMLTIGSVETGYSTTPVPDSTARCSYSPCSWC